MKTYIRLVIASLSIVAFCLLIDSHVSANGYRGPTTQYFYNDRFHNRIDNDFGFFDIARLVLQMPFERQRWPDRVEYAQSSIPRSRVFDGLSLTFINHAAVLLQVDGINIITDPIYSKRASPLSWLGPTRARVPGIALADLPPIDVILISHNHYDHLDIETLQKIQNRAVQEASPLILAGLGNGDLFERNGLQRFHDLAWDEVFEFNGIQFFFTESRHGSGRGVSDQMRTLWGGFIIKASLGNVYFAGDTGYGPHFKEIAQKYGNIVLSLLPVGAYEPRWFMERVHINPAEAVQAHRDLKSEQSIGIHYGTFQIRTYEGIDQPADELRHALDTQNIPSDEFSLLNFGESRMLIAR